MVIFYASLGVFIEQKRCIWEVCMDYVDMINETVEQAVTVLSQTWRYDAWLYLSLSEYGWHVDHVCSDLDIAIGDKMNHSEGEYPLLEGVVRYPSVISLHFHRGASGYHIDNIQASLMHPLTDAKGHTFGAFVGLAKRGVSADYNRAIPILSVFAEFIMLNRELIKNQGFIKNQREKALAVAKEDVLTRVCNRRGWEDNILRVKGQMARRRYTHGILVLDINGMKAINDTKGHEAGDAYLVSFTDVVRQRLRDGDVFARLGGDEFVILAYDTDYNGVDRLMVDLEKSFTQNGISCAMGACVFDNPDGFDAALNRADIKMFESKKKAKVALKADLAVSERLLLKGNVDTKAVG